MKTILQINVVVNQGSTGKIVEQIGHLAMKRGWRSIIMYGRWPRKSESELIRIGSDLDMRIHAFQSRFLDNSGLASKGATRKMINQIKEINPDVIHIHNIHGYYLNYVMLFDFLKAIGKPVVWTLHDCWPMSGHCFHPVLSGCVKWTTFCDRCPQKRDYPKSWWLDRSSRNFRLKKECFTGVSNLRIVTVSKWLASEVSKSYLKEYALSVIPNGVNVEIFRPTDACSNHNIITIFESNKKVIVGVANAWGEHKGLNEIIELRSILPQDYLIVLVGLSPKQIKQMPEGILGIARTDSQQDLAYIYSHAMAVISLSRAETFGMTMIEGFSCGTPAFVFDNTAQSEIITPETGVVVGSGDVVAMANAIMKMNETPLSSEACRQHVLEHFDKDKCFEKYVELYESFLCQ